MFAASSNSPFNYFIWSTNENSALTLFSTRITISRISTLSLHNYTVITTNFPKWPMASLEPNHDHHEDLFTNPLLTSQGQSSETLVKCFMFFKHKEVWNNYCPFIFILPSTAGNYPTREKKIKTFFLFLKTFLGNIFFLPY